MKLTYCRSNHWIRWWYSRIKANFTMQSVWSLIMFPSNAMSLFKFSNRQYGIFLSSMWRADIRYRWSIFLLLFLVEEFRSIDILWCFQALEIFYAPQQKLSNLGELMALQKYEEHRNSCLEAPRLFEEEKLDEESGRDQFRTILHFYCDQRVSRSSAQFFLSKLRKRLFCFSSPKIPSPIPSLSIYLFLATSRNASCHLFEAHCRIFNNAFSRVIGSLLSAHLILTDESNMLGDYWLRGYDGELLTMAHDLASRLLPAFEGTKTGWSLAVTCFIFTKFHGIVFVEI